MVVTVSFDADGGRTTLTVHTRFASTAMYDEHVGGGIEEGLNSGLDQLADVVTRMQSEEKRR